MKTYFYATKKHERLKELFKYAIRQEPIPEKLMSLLTEADMFDFTPNQVKNMQKGYGFEPHEVWSMIKVFNIMAFTLDDLNKVVSHLNCYYINKDGEHALGNIDLVFTVPERRREGGAEQLVQDTESFLINKLNVDTAIACITTKSALKLFKKAEYDITEKPLSSEQLNARKEIELTMGDYGMKGDLLETDFIATKTRSQYLSIQADKNAPAADEEYEKI